MPNEKREEEKKIRKRIKRQYILSGLLLLATLIVIVAANEIKQDTEFSPTENRMLSQKPEMDWGAIKDGSFMTDYESYVSDQFIGRDWWISLKLSVDRLLGKKESNGVYLGKQQYLMEALSTPDEVNLERNLNAVVEFQKKHADLNIFFTLIPNAAYILTDYMPDNAPVRDQEADIGRVKEKLGEAVKFLDVTETMKASRREGIYYKTDHHLDKPGSV